MSRRCELTGVGPMVGHNVSHSNIKTKRRFLPALSPATLQSDALGQSFKLRVSNAALRTLDYKGGLDVFLAGARDEQLSPRAPWLPRRDRRWPGPASAWRRTPARRPRRSPLWFLPEWRPARQRHGAP